MNRIQKLFSEKNNILSIYFTAGYPQLNDTEYIITSLSRAGVDMIEIGIPFSDPVADGAIIQKSNAGSLKNGMNVATLFKQLKPIRSITNIPLIIMSYINPVIQYGMEQFLQDAKDCGIDGAIIPDLPLSEFKKSWKGMANRHNMDFIFMVSPQTSHERILEIDSLSSGFIYVMTSAITTGGAFSFGSEQIEYFKYLKNLKLQNHLIAGFGIDSSLKFEQVCAYLDGGIIGSKFINVLEGNMSNHPHVISGFIQEFLHP